MASEQFRIEKAADNQVHVVLDAANGEPLNNSENLKQKPSAYVNIAATSRAIFRMFGKPEIADAITSDGHGVYLDGKPIEIVDNTGN